MGSNDAKLRLEARLALRLARRGEAGGLRALPPPRPSLEGDFASNDYRGHARHRGLQQALAHAGAPNQPMRLGATGSRLLTGNSSLALAAEQALAQGFRAPAALLFNSGYSLNLGLLQALPQEGDIILLDELCHASLKDGLRLSKAKGYYFRHSDCEHLQQRLERFAVKLVGDAQIFVVIESIYSMDGDLAPLASILAVCERYGAALIVDEAHGVGTLGSWGEGLVAALGCEERVFARIHTFGKAMGVHGAALLGSPSLCAYMINFCHSFIYTTALPEHGVMALLLSLKLLQEDHAPLGQLQNHIVNFNAKLGLTNHASPIYSFIMPALPQLKGIVATLAREGLHVLPIYSPTVRKGLERLRVCLHSFNTEEEVDRLWKVLHSYDGHWQKPICDGY